MLFCLYLVLLLEAQKTSCDLLFICLFPKSVCVNFVLWLPEVFVGFTRKPLGLDFPLKESLKPQIQ